MNCARSRFLALAALSCSAGTVVANDISGNLPPDTVPVREQGAAAPQRVTHTKTDLVRSFTGETLAWGDNRFVVPLQQETWQFDSQHSLFVNALAIEWQHDMNTNNSLTLSARRGNSLYSDTAIPGTSGTAATLSWSTLFGGESHVIGRLYAGDEDTKERSNGIADRRYYGLQVEGRYGLWRDHAPFASLKWQRSNVETQGESGTANSQLRRESFSYLGAGWNWQVSPSWDVRAEAKYRLADDSVEVDELDRTQFYFSSRYGFR